MEENKNDHLDCGYGIMGGTDFGRPCCRQLLKNCTVCYRVSLEEVDRISEYYLRAFDGHRARESTECI